MSNLDKLSAPNCSNDNVREIWTPKSLWCQSGQDYYWLFIYYLQTYLQIYSTRQRQQGDMVKYFNRVIVQIQSGQVWGMLKQVFVQRMNLIVAEIKSLQCNVSVDPIFVWSLEYFASKNIAWNKSVKICWLRRFKNSLWCIPFIMNLTKHLTMKI